MQVGEEEFEGGLFVDGNAQGGHGWGRFRVPYRVDGGAVERSPWYAVVAGGGDVFFVVGGVCVDLSGRRLYSVQMRSGEPFGQSCCR